jgi:hypothetical protein
MNQGHPRAHWDLFDTVNSKMAIGDKWPHAILRVAYVLNYTVKIGEEK